MFTHEKYRLKKKQQHIPLPIPYCLISVLYFPLPRVGIDNQGGKKIKHTFNKIIMNFIKDSPLISNPFTLYAFSLWWLKEAFINF